MPGTVVWVVLNSPRTSAGAFGFGSNVSWWEGPPSRKNTTHAVLLALEGSVVSEMDPVASCGSIPSVPGRDALRRVRLLWQEMESTSGSSTNRFDINDASY